MQSFESQDQAVREKVQAIFLQMDVLSIRRSVHLLCSLETQDIEQFASVHSSVIIFFLNILDQRRSSLLLQKLSNAAILYIIEEELRMRLIREISVAEEDLVLENISLLLDAIDDPGRVLAPGAGAVFESIYAAGTERQERFSYLSSVSHFRLKRVLETLLERNPPGFLTLMCYADAAIKDLAFELLHQIRPEILSLLPSSLLNEKIKENYDSFMDVRVFEHLPDEQKRAVQELADFVRSSAAQLDLLSKRARSRSFLAAVLDVSGVLKPDLRDFLFLQLKKELLLSVGQMHLLRSYLEQRMNLI